MYTPRPQWTQIRKTIKDNTDLEFHSKLRVPWWAPSFRRLRTLALNTWTVLKSDEKKICRFYKLDHEYSWYPQTYEAPSFPESLELPSKLQVCIILNCLSAKLSYSRSLWPLSVHCVQCIEKLFSNSRISDLLTEHNLVQYNLICFTHTLYHKKVILMYTWEKTKI